MKIFIILTLVFLIAGCVYPARYTELEQGRYQVVSTGSVLGSKETYLSRIETRANKLCGEAGFEYEDIAITETKSSLSPVGSAMMDVPYNSVSRVVVCKE